MTFHTALPKAQEHRVFLCLWPTAMCFSAASDHRPVACTVAFHFEMQCTGRQGLPVFSLQFTLHTALKPLLSRKKNPLIGSEVLHEKTNECLIFLNLESED